MVGLVGLVGLMIMPNIKPKKTFLWRERNHSPELLGLSSRKLC